jgi:dUTPase
MSSTPIYITDGLKEALKQNNIEPSTYGPAYGGESACLDLYCTGYEVSVPSISDNTKAARGTLIPTGLHIALPPDRVALIIERSSITKTDLKVRAGCIDAGYRGMIFVNCVNLSDSEIPYIFSFGQKLPFQLLITSAFNEFSQLSLEEWEALGSSSARQGGCVGSSDIKV